MKNKNRAKLKSLMQVGMVVSNFKRAIEKYFYKYHISPIKVVEYNSDIIENMRIYGKKKNFSMTNGFFDIGNINFEIIKPNSKSIYTDYLSEYGEGIMHHLKIEVYDYDKAIEYFKKLGVKEILHGESLGEIGKNLWTYLDTREILGFIIEIVKLDPTFVARKPNYIMNKKNNTKEDKTIFRGVSKVGIVTKNLLESIKKYEDLLGLSPWLIEEYNNENLSNMQIYGKNKDYSFKVGYYKLGNVEIALTEALDESIFSYFIDKYGEGVICYLGIEVEDYNNALAFFNSNEIDVIQSGKYLDKIEYKYLSASCDLNFIIEISEKKYF
jgi:hypothetical protein